MSRRSDLRRIVSRFDDVVDSSFDHLRGRPVVDRVLYTATELGDFSLIWLILGTLRGLRSERDFRAALRLGLSLGAESLLVNGLIKSVFRRRRPVTEMAHPHHFRQPLTTSFPSGHATSAFSAAVLLSEDDVLWPLYIAVAIIVASSRGPREDPPCVGRGGRCSDRRCHRAGGPQGGAVAARQNGAARAAGYARRILRPT